LALTFKPKRQRKLPILKLLGLAIVGLILLLVSNAFSATDGERRVLKDQIGRYQMVSIQSKEFENKELGAVVMVLDTITGQVRVCEKYESAGYEKNYAPDCYGWSKDDRDENGK
jgi:hypothetical protein